MGGAPYISQSWTDTYHTASNVLSCVNSLQGSQQWLTSTLQGSRVDVNVEGQGEILNNLLNHSRRSWLSVLSTKQPSSSEQVLLKLASKTSPSTAFLLYSEHSIPATPCVLTVYYENETPMGQGLLSFWEPRAVLLQISINTSDRHSTSPNTSTVWHRRGTQFP